MYFPFSRFFYFAHSKSFNSIKLVYNKHFQDICEPKMGKCKVLGVKCHTKKVISGLAWVVFMVLQYFKHDNIDTSKPLSDNCMNYSSFNAQALLLQPVLETVLLQLFLCSHVTIQINVASNTCYTCFSMRNIRLKSQVTHVSL